MSSRSLALKMFLFVLLIYFGSGAYLQWELLDLWDMPVTDNTPLTINGKAFANAKSAQIAAITEIRDSLYPWASLLGYYWQIIGLLAMTCGASGGFLREIFYAIENPRKLVPSWMLLGSFTGPAVILCISGFREVLIEAGDYKTWSIASFSFLSGCFCEESFNYLKKIYNYVDKEILD